MLLDLNLLKKMIKFVDVKNDLQSNIDTLMQK